MERGSIIMRTTRRLLAILLLFAIISTFAPIATAQGTFTEGTYIIRNLNGMYLAGADGTLVTSATIDDYVWHVRLHSDGRYEFFAQTLFGPGFSWVDSTIIFSKPGLGQSFDLTQESDGSYRISPWWSSDMSSAVTDNGAGLLVFAQYTGSNSQKWVFTPVANGDSHTSFMSVIIATTESDIITHNAKNETNASLRKLISDNPDKINMVEGEYVVLHLPNNIWAKYSDPKTLIDTYDSIYRAQFELTGNKAKPYAGKLYFLTDCNPNAAYMYISVTCCVASLPAVENNANFWAAGDRINALWGAGHEIGHAMVNIGMGRIFEGYDGESWNNVLNVYALSQVGLSSEARKKVADYPGDYGYSNDTYTKYSGRDYDELNDDERTADILAVNTHMFVKLPILLTDNYGWEGMRRFFTKAAEDKVAGMSAGTDIQARIDYMVVNLSNAYNMDLSMLFDYWKVSPSESARRQTADLPIEKTIAASYSLQPVPALGSASSWARADITRAYSLGIVPDSLQQKYSQAATRAEFCAFAVALYETVTGKVITERLTFIDTNDVNVEKMAALGVVNGVGDNKFAPNSPLTREQAATMLSRLADAIGNPLPKQQPTFSDNGSIASWAVEAVGQMQATGIMGGVGNNTFAPKGDYTREQSIITLLRMIP